MPRMPCGQESLLYLLAKNRILFRLLPPLEGEDPSLYRRVGDCLAERPCTPVYALADLAVIDAGADTGRVPWFMVRLCFRLCNPYYILYLWMGTNTTTLL